MSNITNISSVPSTAAAHTSTKPHIVSAPQAATKTASIKADQTAISNHSLLISKAVNVSDVRTDKVAALQQSISDGSYNVSSSDVAGSLITSLLG